MLEGEAPASGGNRLPGLPELASYSVTPKTSEVFKTSEVSFNQDNRPIAPTYGCLVFLPPDKKTSEVLKTSEVSVTSSPLTPSSAAVSRVPARQGRG
jgi:hypothetical protein